MNSLYAWIIISSNIRFCWKTSIYILVLLFLIYNIWIWYIFTRSITFLIFFYFIILYMRQFLMFFLIRKKKKKIIDLIKTCLSQKVDRSPNEWQIIVFIEHVLFLTFFFQLIIFRIGKLTQMQFTHKETVLNQEKVQKEFSKIVYFCKLFNLKMSEKFELLKDLTIKFLRKTLTLRQRVQIYEN